jgi:Ca2+-binding RTX toxin-like protein
MATIFGSTGNDTLSALASGDVVLGYAGDDDLHTLFSDTTLSGGPGDDTLVAVISEQSVAGNPDPVRGRVSLDGNAGSDSLSATITVRTTTPTSEGASGAEAGATLRGGSSDDVLTSNILVEADTPLLLANCAVAALLAGDLGDDTIAAVSRIVADGPGWFSIDDTVEGGGGHDVISTETVIRLVTGGSLDITQPDAAVSVSGGDGGDTITTRVNVVTDAEWYGYAHATASGGAGDDEITLIVSNRSESTLYENYASAVGDGGDGDDVITVRSSCNATFGYITNNLSGGSGNDVLSAYITSAAASPGGDANNIVDGGSGNDRITASIQAGLIGSNELTGGGGDDRLTAVGGTDNLIAGGAGNDTMVGGAGNESFVFGSETNNGIFERDRINNYNASHGDQLDLPNGVADVLSWQVVGSNTELVLAGDQDLIVLAGVTISALGDLIIV